MECNKCNLEMMLEEGKITSEVGSTDVYLEHKYKCRNPKCPNYDQVVEIKKIKLN